MENKQRNYRKNNNYMDSPEYNDKFPSKPYGKPDDIKDHISIKALRDLPKSSYSIKADPYQAALPVSTPYNILAPFLKTVGGTYAGQDNIDGGNVKQYPNAVLSKFLDTFDSMIMKLGINYRFLPIASDEERGKYLVDEMRKSIAEAISVLQSTTFTNLGINDMYVETNLNMGSAQPTEIAGKQVYSKSVDVLYAMSIYYQIFLQEALSVFNWHNSFRLKQGTAIRDAWGREVAIINSFFGLMNKKAFINLLESISLSFEGEYVDTDFMSQINILTLMPSRKSNSMIDPVLEIAAVMNRPSIFKVYIKNGDSLEEVFDDSKMKITIDDTEIDYWTACKNIKELLSLTSIKEWARDQYDQSSLDIFDTETGNALYNSVKEQFDVIINAFTYFKPQFTDFRECLDTMARTGTISWTKNFRPSVTKSTDAQLYQNLIVDNIYTLVMSGSDEANFNTKTKRWATFSMWDIYKGIPQYDAKQGGAFLTLSTKEYDYESEDMDQIYYVPTMFKYLKDENGSLVKAVSRKGRVVGLDYSAEVMSSNSVLARLAPLLSQSNLKIRIPYVNYVSARGNDSSLDVSEASHVYNLLTKTFGLCKISKVVNISEDQSITVDDYSLDPDLLAIYQIEIDDVTNISITYARAYAPFRGTTSDAGLIGFKSAPKEK